VVVVAVVGILFLVSVSLWWEALRCLLVGCMWFKFCYLTFRFGGRFSFLVGCLGVGVFVCCRLVDVFVGGCRWGCYWLEGFAGFCVVGWWVGVGLCFVFVVLVWLFGVFGVGVVSWVF